MLVLTIAISIAMIVSFMCSVMEAALLSINPGKLALLGERFPGIGKICEKFKQDIEKPIAVILILNTTAHTFGAAIAGAQFDKLYGSDYIWLFSLVFTLLMVQYTEILPKTIGVRFNSPILLYTARILNWSVWFMTPVIWLVHLINSPFESKSEHKEGSSDVAIEELDALTSLARRANHLSPSQEQAMHQIPRLREKRVSELMIPLRETVCLTSEMKKEDVLDVIRQTTHSRYPVRENNGSGDFIGVLEVRELVGLDDRNWQRLIHPITRIGSEETQLHIAENAPLFDSKLLLVQSAEGTPLGTITTNDLFKSLF